MLRERAREVAAAVAFCDVLLLCLAFFLAFGLRSEILPRLSRDLPGVSLSNLLWLLLLSIPTFHLLLRKGGVYKSLRTRSFLDLPVLLAKPIALGGLFLGAAIFVVQAKYFSRSLFGLFLGLFYVLLLLEKLLIRNFQRVARRRGFNFRNVLIVGINEGALRLADALGEERDFGFRVAGFVNGFGQEYIEADRYKVLGSVSDIPDIVVREIVDEIIFALPMEQLARCESQILKCEEVGTKIHIRADFAHSIFSRTYLSSVSGIPILTLTSTPHAAGDILLKRLMDVIVSFAGLVLTSPLMLIIAALIKLESKGPVLFRQVRTGLNGRRFVLLKFRSMVHDAERQQSTLEDRNEMSGPVFKLTHDPRVTQVGGFLRRTSLDELPQLWNVLMGDMSLVGPRPPLPSEVKRYERWQRRRLSMKPGMTCLWQAGGRNEVDFDEWMRLDMEYIDTWSLTQDFKIILKTIPAVLFARGAK
jgi:exopolysaccharide biosynthesis polyprenyl glycosylphosphotransferase